MDACTSISSSHHLGADNVPIKISMIHHLVVSIVGTARGNGIWHLARASCMRTDLQLEEEEPASGGLHFDTAG